MDENISRLISKFSADSCKAELYLSIQSTVASNYKKGTKNLYDIAKCEEENPNDTALPELIIQGFDDEQIWQELELQNEPAINQLLPSIAKLSSKLSLSLVGDNVEQGWQSKKQSQLNDGSSKHQEKGSDQMEKEEICEEQQPEEEDASETDEDIAALMKGYGKDSYNSDESEEEQYLKDLLDQATKAQDDSANSEGDEDLSGAEDGDKDSASDDGDLEELDKGFFKDSSEQMEMGSNRMTDKMQKVVKVFGQSGRDSNKHQRKTIVDDKFFSLADMEVFLEQEDRREERKIAAEKGGRNLKRSQEDGSEQEDSDTAERKALDMLYEEGLSESDGEDELKSGKDIKYEDFFGSQSEEHSMVDLEGQESEEEGDFDEEEMDDTRDIGDSPSVEAQDKQGAASDLFEQSDSEGEDLQDVIGGAKSTYQKRQQKLGQKIKNMEDTALEEKPWQLKGEIAAASRPLNSLLEEDLEFEQQTKTAPAITEETTKSLEDIIKQRIKDKVFDDVERKDKPKEEAFEYKKRILLDQEKSKKSLGQVYEEEYLKQTEEEADEREDPQREQIRNMMQSLFLKLDALSNFQYTPKPAAPEVQIINNMPSIAMEEVQPVSVSDAALLAPEEIKEKDKRELKGATEKTKSDKLRERKDKKIRQRKKNLAKERKQQVLEKIAPSLGNKYAKEKAMKELEKQSKAGKGVSVIKEKTSRKKTGLTSSKQFFTQLQEEVTTQIQAKKSVKQKKEKKRHSGSKLKL